MVEHPGPAPLPPRTIRGSRAKAVALLAVSLGLTVLALVMFRARESGEAFWGVAVLTFLGACDLVFGWVAFRPQTLALDGEGFTLAGGLMRGPRSFRWRDVTGFFLFTPPPAGGRMIGFNYAPGARPRDARVELNRSLGADEGLPQFWEMRPKEMVALLNAYRSRAVAGEERRGGA